MRHRNKRVSPKTPASVWFFDVMEGETLAVFFHGIFSGDCSPFFGVSFRVLSVLAFLAEGFWR